MFFTVYHSIIPIRNLGIFFNSSILQKNKFRTSEIDIEFRYIIVLVKTMFTLWRRILPGIYLVNCKCGKQYVGKTSLKVSTRMEQHRKTIQDEKWDSTIISNHLKACKEGFEWENAKTLTVEQKKFQRKV